LFSDKRESITFVSSKSQYGHCTLLTPHGRNTTSGIAKT
jgi:hypothetical protein